MWPLVYVIFDTFYYNLEQVRAYRQGQLLRNCRAILGLEHANIGLVTSCLWQVQKKYIRYIYKNNEYFCYSVLHSTRVIGFSLRYLKKKYPVTWDPLTPELAQPFRLRVTTIHLSFTLIHLFISNTYIDWHYTCGLPWIVLDIPKGLLWCRCRKLFRRLSRHHESAFEKALHWSSNRAWRWYR